MRPEADERENPLLPLMASEPFRVSRINRFDDGSRTKEMNALRESVLVRLRAHLITHLPQGATDSLDSFSSLVDFTLLHEFNSASRSDFFDWHVDTKPNDDKGRTLNINVMLSQSGTDYTGGELVVGNQTLVPKQGDAYVYPAALPHKVTLLRSGRRHTLVVALTERHLEAYNQAGRRDAYWSDIEGRLSALTGSHAETAQEPKLHILHGEFLEASGRAKEAQRAFCTAYQKSDDFDYAARFYAMGTDALQPGRLDVRLAESYLEMASCVDPQHEAAAAALQVVRDAQAIRRQQDATLTSDAGEEPGKAEL